MSRFAALAAQMIGRRVELRNGSIGTITRVTEKGLSVTLPGIRADDIRRWLD